MSGPESQKNHAMALPSPESAQPIKRLVQNFFLVWIDNDINKSAAYFHNSLIELRSVVSDVNRFTQEDEAIDFLTDMHEMSAFLIVTGVIDAQILPLIHDIPSLDAIYILASNQSQHPQCTNNNWVKIKGIYTDISSICSVLQLATKQCEQDSIPMSFLNASEKASDGNLDRLDPSFMYTHLFKDILLEMNDEENSVQVFTDYSRTFYEDNANELLIIDEFERSYRSASVLSWYTRNCFVYKMLNRALRTLEGDTIINMGFLIRDLHRQIQQLHSVYIENSDQQPFTVYRGQGLSKADFEKLTKTKGGLISFNNFLSTSKKQDVSLVFAKNARLKSDMVGILFQITIHPSVAYTPFAFIRDYSCYKTEEEILFSMHSIFRVITITQLDANNSLYQVDLTQTTDDDRELRVLRQQMQKELQSGEGWHGLGNLLIQLSQWDNAEKLYNARKPATSDINEKELHYHQLGCIKRDLGDYEKAIEYFEQSLEICQKTLPANHPSLATCYGNMAGVYGDMGEYSKALSFYEKDLEICQKTLPANHPSLATCYGNMAGVYRHMGEYSKALSFYEKDLEIKQKTLPANHPSLATCYGNMAGVYRDMGEYSKALSFYEKDLEICQKTLPANHPSLATCYGNMAGVYGDMGEYSKALSFYEKDLEICQKTLPANHPSLPTCYGNMAGVYRHMGEYSKALSFYEKNLEIKQKTLPANHPSLATCYGNMAGVYRDMGEYSKALSFYEKDLEICQKTLPANHPSLATSYGNMAGVYHDMGEYSKALSFYEKDLEIKQTTLPPANHPALAVSYSNVAVLYNDMSNYSKSDLYFEKARNIFRSVLPVNHPHIQLVERNIEWAKRHR